MGTTLLPNGEQQFFDNNGNPLDGGLVYFYVPFTNILKDTWQDAASTILNSNPVVLNSAGRAIIYGDGVYRQVVQDALANLIWDQLTASTNESGVFVGGASGGTPNAQTLSIPNFSLGLGDLILFTVGITNTSSATMNIQNTGDIPITKLSGTIQVPLTGGELTAGNFTALYYDGTQYQIVGIIGATSSAEFTVGDFKWRLTGGSIAGWVRANALTIGSAASLATELASNVTLGLFTYLWDNFTNVQCPVSGGRGISAAADFAANKTIQLFDMRGTGQFGLDDMGNAAAGRFTGVPFATGNAITPASIAGENAHALTAGENAAHTHALTDPGHTHPYERASLVQQTPAGGLGFAVANVADVTSSSVTGITIDPSGSGTAHNTVQRSLLGTWYMKL